MKKLEIHCTICGRPVFELPPHGQSRCVRHENVMLRKKEANA